MPPITAASGFAVSPIARRVSEVSGYSSDTPEEREATIDSNERTELKTQLVLGRYLVMGSITDKTIVLYDIQTSRVLTTLKTVPQTNLMEDVRLSADAKTVLQINSDGQFFLYDV